MIKNIYYKHQKKYYHEYYCDSCFTKIKPIIVYGMDEEHIFRHSQAMEKLIFDLCRECFHKYNNKYGKE